MKKITIDRASSKALDDLLLAAQTDDVLVKRQGRPIALIIDVQGKDEEQIETENDPEFWRMIEEARKRPTVPFEQARARLLGANGSRRKEVKRKIGKKGK